MEAGAEEFVDIKDELPSSSNQDTFPFNWTTSEMICPRDQSKFSNSEPVIPSSCLEDSTDQHVIKYLKAPRESSFHVQDEPVGITLPPDGHESTHNTMYPYVAVKKEPSVGTNDISLVSRLDTNFLTPTVNLVRLEYCLDPEIKKYLAKMRISANPVKLESVDLGTLSYETIGSIPAESNVESVVGFPKNIKIEQGEEIYDETPSQKSQLTTNSCDRCQQSFARTIELARHDCVGVREKWFQYDLCQKRKRHRCDICEKSFSRSQGLTRHMLTHTGEKQHQCDSCQRSFSDQSNLKRHMGIHTEEKRYRCDICEKSFRWNHVLTGHILTHTGEKQHQCDSCPRSFTLKSNLKRHMNIHTRDK